MIGLKIDKASQIATKTGDKGDSGDYSGNRLSKSDRLFSVLGKIDEASSFIGLATHYVSNPDLVHIQTDLQAIMTLVATDPDDPKRKELTPNKTEDSAWLESCMDNLLAKYPVEPMFFLPGSDTSLGGAYLDMARAITRSAERELVAFIREKHRHDLCQSLTYLNRLSDLLFVYVRTEAQKLG